MPSHTHDHRFWVNNGASSSSGVKYQFGYTTNMGCEVTGSATSELRHYNLSTGGSAAHNNMPPYKVFYCWERIA